LTASTPNRLHLWTGTIRARQDASSPANVRNSNVDYKSTARWTTFPERLEEAGISWKIYQNEISLESGLTKDEDAWLANFTDNPLEWFEQYHVELSESHRRYLERRGTPAGSAEKPLPRRERDLHEKAFTTNSGDPDYRGLATLRYRNEGVPREMKIPKGDVLYRFRRDVRTGKLPTVSWLVAPENFSDHPSAPWYGAWYVAEVMNILTHNPEVWKKTIFLLTYDENDGYFDHLPPFVAPDPANPETGKTSPGIDAALEYWPLERDLAQHPEKEARGGPIGLGFRVPLVVASPWSRGGYVCSQVFDHTSVLQLLETVLSRKSSKPVKETNISAWRRAVCGDLHTAFRPYRQQRSGSLPFPSRDEFLESIHNAQFKRFPSGYRRLSAEDRDAFERDRFAAAWMPQQETGVRPSCALPYQLYAGAKLNPDSRSVELALEARTEAFGKESAGSPFHVYTPGKFRNQTGLRTRAYTVRAGGRLTDLWELAGFENGVYRLRVHGPNGFFREFTGSAADPQIEIQCEYAHGDIEIQVTNRGSACTVHIADEAYQSGARSIDIAEGAKQSLTLPLSRSFGWYDIGATVAGHKEFARRYAGHVETGKSSFSDPAMGRVKI
jgi:phospholipase C